VHKVCLAHKEMRVFRENRAHKAQMAHRALKVLLET
jgi:hypothetical protein